MRRTIMVLLVVLGLAAGLAHSRPLGRGAAGSAGEPSLVADHARLSGLKISGHVRGLYPGARGPLLLSVANPNSFAVRIASIRVIVGSAGEGCGAGDLVVKGYDGDARVRPHSRRVVRTRIRMRLTAPDACQGVAFPLRYKGRATR